MNGTLLDITYSKETTAKIKILDKLILKKTFELNNFSGTLWYD